MATISPQVSLLSLLVTDVGGGVAVGAGVSVADDVVDGHSPVGVGGVSKGSMVNVTFCLSWLSRMYVFGPSPAESLYEYMKWQVATYW